MSAPDFDDAAGAQLCANAMRLLEAALRADEAQWAVEDAATPPPEAAPGLPNLDLAAMDLGMLDGLGEEPVAPPAPDAAELQRAQDALPAGLAPLAQPLSPAEFTQWLALYRQGEPAVVELVALARQFDLQRRG